MNQPTQQDIDSFCRRHWLRLYGMARHRGLDEQEAQDAVQDLFMSLLQNDQLVALVQMPSPEQQVAFLFTRLGWLLLNRKRDQQRQRRGGGVQIVSLHDEAAEIPEPADHHTSDQQHATAWVNEVLETALTRLRGKMKPDAWQALSPTLCDADGQQAAQPGALRVALHRARQRLQWLITHEVDGASCPRDAAMQLFSAMGCIAQP